MQISNTIRTGMHRDALPSRANRLNTDEVESQAFGSTSTNLLTLCVRSLRFNRSKLEEIRNRPGQAIVFLFNILRSLSRQIPY
jgi:hypothetical protein